MNFAWIHKNLQNNQSWPCCFEIPDNMFSKFPRFPHGYPLIFEQKSLYLNNFDWTIPTERKYKQGMSENGGI